MNAPAYDLRAVTLDALTEAADYRKDKYAFCADCRDQPCPDHEEDDRVAWTYELAAALITGRAAVDTATSITRGNPA